MSSCGVSTSLTEASFRAAIGHLARRDPDLAGVVERHGPPPFWKRSEGFATLIYIILEQQVSLASARAAYERLTSIADPLTPERFLTLDAECLKGVGFSRQKTGYGRALAQTILEGKLDLTALGQLDDDAAATELMKVRGVGRWTSGIYLLTALKRTNIWPKEDLALRAAVQSLKNLPDAPTPEEMDAFGSLWHPWRAVAARILWHHYLSTPPRRDLPTQL